MTGTSTDRDPLIEYPSLFPIKVMGRNEPGFEQAIVDIALQFDPSYERTTLQLRPSSGGKYVGLTLNITATSREQLDALYRCLSSHPLVKVVL
jgi:putative lipoic acid-binding regulatory protein